MRSIFVTLAAMVLLVVISTFVPNEAIWNHYVESAVWLEGVGEHPEIADGNVVFNSSDRNQLDVAYGRDTFAKSITNPWHSLVSGDGFGISILADEEYRIPYARYWHGNAYILRILLVVFNLQGMRVLNFILYLGLTACVICMLLKRDQAKIAIAYLVSSIVACSWENALVCASLPVWLIATGAVICMLKGCRVNFAVLGILTAFFDYTTNETLTVTIPLVIALAAGITVDVLRSIRDWGIGFCSTWLAKILLCAASGNWDNFMAGVRDQTQMVSDNIFAEAVNSVFMNIRWLFPLNYVLRNGAIVVVILLVVAWCWFKRAEVKKYLLVWALPFLRYTVLCSTSLVHCFFMFRSLQPVVFVLVFVALQKVGKSKLSVRSFA